MRRVTIGLDWRFAAPLLLVPAMLAIATPIAYYLFGQQLNWLGLLMEAVLQLAVGFWLARWFRRPLGYAVMHGFIIIFIALGNAARIGVYGTPILPADIAAIPALIMIAEPWMQALAALVLLLLLAWCWREKRIWSGGTWWARYQPRLGLMAAPMLLAILVALWPQHVTRVADNLFGFVVWNQVGNYQDRGPLLYWLNETGRSLAEALPPPRRAEIGYALNQLEEYNIIRAAAKTAPKKQPPNIYVIVLESFFDPSQLQKVAFSRHPLHKDFRRLWQRGGASHTISPTFGGFTANAEYEALCGFPVMRPGVEFEMRVRRDAPCLPRLLSDQGYETIAIHPNVGAFWNRVNAYRHLGFEQYWDKRQFALDDMQGEFLSDQSLYAQVMEKIKPARENGTPLFTYILTFAGHLPYPLNEQRPNVLTARSIVPEVELFANNIYYKSKEAVEFINKLRRDDPNAIIVAFGDHLPFLGWNFDAYNESGWMHGGLAEADATALVKLHSTPLVVINGRHGVQNWGDIPTYHLPSRIAGLLGLDAGLMGKAAAIDGMLLRPFAGRHIQIGLRQTILCDDDNNNPECVDGRAKLQAVETLQRDIFQGNQHSLGKITGGNTPAM